MRRAVWVNSWEHVFLYISKFAPTSCRRFMRQRRTGRRRCLAWSPTASS